VGTHNDVDEGGDNADVESQLQAQDELTLSINIDPSTNVTANTTKRHFFEAKWPVEIIEVNYLADAAGVVNATNYLKLGVYKGTGAAAAATVVATANTAAGSNMAAGTPHALTLSSTAANLLLATSQTLAYDVLKYGSGGLALPKGALVVHYRRQ
jgi:hypothetical protein